ncbi:MAG: Uma2 family endonuclease, partial [Chloroflexota bacterium]
MALPQQTHQHDASRMTPEEYLAFERSSDERHEYIGGRVYFMGGSNRYHNLIKVNIQAIIHGAVRHRNCIVLGSQMRINITKNNAYVYADVVALCGEPEPADPTSDNLLNPQVVVEILSPTVRYYGKGGKFDLYRGLDTLQEYLLVSQDVPHIAHHIRQSDNTWLTRDVVGMDAAIHLTTVDIELTLAAVYE